MRRPGATWPQAAEMGTKKCPDERPLTGPPKYATSLHVGVIITRPSVNASALAPTTQEGCERISGVIDVPNIFPSGSSQSRSRAARMRPVFARAAEPVAYGPHKPANQTNTIVIIVAIRAGRSSDPQGNSWRGPRAARDTTLSTNTTSPHIGISSKATPSKFGCAAQ
jgi:hypothetical protein